MSNLTNELNIKTEKELLDFMETSTPKSKAMAYDVIFNESTYEATGNKFGVTKNAVYELMKRIYKKKYGKKYSNY